MWLIIATMALSIRIDRHVLDEATVDLEIVHRQMLEIGERRHAAAGIVEREATAEPCSARMKSLASERLAIAL